MNLLYVCRKNTNRSPAAEIITRAIARKQGLEIEVDSAGLYSPFMQGTHEVMVSALRQMGYSPEERDSRIITEELVKESDLVLCTSPKQLGVLEKRFPNQKKFHNLSRYSGYGNKEVTDPSKRIVTLPPPLNHLANIPPMPFLMFNILGRAEGHNEKYVDKIHLKTIRELEKYCAGVVERIKREQKQF